MDMKWIGALLVLSGCSGIGLYMAGQYRKELNSLKKLISALDYMSSELQYRLTPLPDLCILVSKECSGKLKLFFSGLAEELDSQIKPDMMTCVRSVIHRVGSLTQVTKNMLLKLGTTLGRFDLHGQIQAIESVRTASRNALNKMESEKSVRIRSYQTLGVCAGAALVIILI
jgi:stage III sporulation protein AB